MAKSRDTALVKELRARGLRKKVARKLTGSAEAAESGKTQKAFDESVQGLREAATMLERRAGRAKRAGSRRSEAAKKAARTRKRNAAKRSARSRAGSR